MWRLWLIGHETCCALVYPCNGRPVDLHTICLCVAGVTCTQFACVLRVQVFSFGACEPRSLQHLAARITALEQLPWSKMIPSREIVQCKKESCKTVVLGKLCATLLIWCGLSTPSWHSCIQCHEYCSVADFSPLAREKIKHQSSDAFTVSSPFQR